MDDESCTMMPETNEPAKRHKRGDVREDGMVFMNYDPTYGGRERWVTPEVLEKSKADDRRRQRERLAANPEIRERQLARYRDIKENDPARLKGYLKTQLESRDNAEYKARRSKYDKDRLLDPAYREARADRRLERLKADPVYALSVRVRGNISQSIRRMGYGKNSFTAAVLGCSWEVFKEHFESLFVDGMSWDCFDEIHIDHKIPISSAETEEELLALNHFSNLQPLWKLDNLRKGAKILN